MREHTFKEIETLLINYQDNNLYAEVDIDLIIKIISHTKSYYVSSEKWEDKRIIKGDDKGAFKCSQR